MHSELADLPHRRAVWSVLSDMFLDTDISITRPTRVQVLAQSPYSVPEIRRILVEEVFPVCAPNLLSPAGEWAMFDREWLEKRILGRRGKLSIGPMLGWILVPFITDWRETKEGVMQLRGQKAT